jgi:hypothetical protein
MISLDQFYEGNWLNGLRHGQGIFKYPNGTFLSYPIQIAYIKANGSKTKSTGMVCISSVMASFMTVNGRMIRNMAKELWFFQIKTDTLANGTFEQVKCRVQGSMHGEGEFCLFGEGIYNGEMRND